MFRGLCDLDHSKYLVCDENAAEKKALQYSRDAFHSFEHVKHLIGMWRCKHNQVYLMSEEEKAEDGGATQKKANQYK